MTGKRSQVIACCSKSRDLKSPATSPVFRELATLTDPLTRHLVDALRTACLEDITRTPWVAELVDPEYAQKAAFAALEAAVQADDDNAIVTAADNAVMRTYVPARKHDDRANSARTNISLLPRLQQALSKQDDEQAVAAWEQLIVTATTRVFKPQVEAARKRIQATKDLQAALKADDYPAIQAAQQKLQSTPAIAPYTKAIREAWVRHERASALERALASGNDALAVKLSDTGCLRRAIVIAHGAILCAPR